MLARALEAAAWTVAAALLAVAPGGSPPQPAADAAPPGLDHPPVLAPGDWWDVLVQEAAGGNQVRGRLVVTGADPAAGTVDFGVGADSISPLVLNFHLLPLGTVPADTLAYDIHGQTLVPLRFPLAPGERWPTMLGPAAAEAVVVSTTTTTADLEYRDLAGTALARGTYDAALGWFSRLAVEEPVSMAVLAHGHADPCPSVFPEGLSMVLGGGASAVPGPERTTTFTVPPSADTVTLVAMADAAGGLARSTLVSPSGAVYRAEAGNGVPHHTVLAVDTAPAGTWTMAGQVVGSGYAAAGAWAFHARPVAPFGAGGCGDGGSGGPAESSIGPPNPAGAFPPSSPFGWSARLVLLAAAFAARHWRRLGWGAVRLFSRLTPGRAAEQPARRRILELLATQPGQTTQALRRGCGIGWGTAVHHLATLQRHGLVVRAVSGRRAYWLLPGADARAAQRAAALAAPRARELAAQVAQAPGLSQRELAQRMGLAHSTVHYHARRLVDAGVLEVRRGRRVRYYPA
jgi:DNA-binding transcriptional ArsR family regulator